MLLAPTIDFFRLFLVVGITVLVLIIGLRKLISDVKSKFFFVLMILGLLFFCGVGFSYSEYVEFKYFIFYLIFLCFLALGFLLGSKYFFRKVDPTKESKFINAFVNNKYAYSVISIYLFVFFIQLLYPTFKLGNIFNPPSLNIEEVWGMGILPQRTNFESIIGYTKNLLFPFFLISLFIIRKKWLVTLIFLTLPYYFEFCSKSYLGRSSLAYVLPLVFITHWFEYPEKRNRLLLITSISFPLLLIILFIWSESRQGTGLIIDYGIQDMMSGLLTLESSFPIFSSVIIDSINRLDLLKYIQWIVTLPIPSILVPSKPSVFINVEIAEIVSGIMQGETGFAVVLTGPVTESIYIFGKTFFWLHALFIGLLAGIMCKFTLLSNKFIFIYAFTIVLFGYVFMRAGVGALLPTLLNAYLSFYVLIYFIFIKNNPKENIIKSSQ